jgi:hypothetical protein
MKKYTIKDVKNLSSLSKKDIEVAKRMIKKLNIDNESNEHPSVKFFKKNSYVKIENLVAKNICEFLYEYVKLEAIRLNIIQNIKPSNNEILEKFFGTFTDHQAVGDFSKYGDLIMDTVLLGCTNEIEKFTGLKLTPTYSYHRLYTQGTELVRHKDRASCEISATVCLGYNNSNIENYNWPMFVKKNKEEIGLQLNPGDCILYKGCEIEHWREPFKGLNQAQLFLHYNIKDGQYNNDYDGRPALGLPKEMNIFDKFLV